MNRPDALLLACGVGAALPECWAAVASALRQCVELRTVVDAQPETVVGGGWKLRIETHVGADGMTDKFEVGDQPRGGKHILDE